MSEQIVPDFDMPAATVLPSFGDADAAAAREAAAVQTPASPMAAPDAAAPDAVAPGVEQAGLAPTAAPVPEPRPSQNEIDINGIRRLQERPDDGRPSSSPPMLFRGGKDPGGDVYRLLRGGIDPADFDIEYGPGTAARVFREGRNRGVPLPATAAMAQDSNSDQTPTSDESWRSHGVAALDHSERGGEMSEKPPQLAPLGSVPPTPRLSGSGAREVFDGEPELGHLQIPVPAYPPFQRLVTGANPNGEAREGRTFAETAIGASGGNIAGASRGSTDRDILESRSSLMITEDPRQLALFSEPWSREQLLATSAIRRRQYREFQERNARALPSIGTEIYDAAFRRVAAQIAYDLSEPEFTQTALLANLAAKALAFETYAPPPTRAVGWATTRLGLSYGPTSVLRIAGALKGAAIDSTVQSFRLHSGVQQEYDIAKTVVAAAVGSAGAQAARSAVGAAGSVAATVNPVRALRRLVGWDGGGSVSNNR
jgi:hypothetical protein